MEECKAVEWAPVDMHNKQFRTRWKGFDPQEVELFRKQVAEELQRLQVDNAIIRKELQDQEKELKEYKEREKVIRNLLVNAQKTVEGMKANAEKEARLIVADAELKAEKIVQEAQQRVSRLHDEVTELKSHRVQLEMKLRATLETYQNLLDMDREDESHDDPESKLKVLNR